jgi:acyl dehydratase
MSEERYLEDFKIGDRFRIPSKTMTDTHFLLFSALTGDNHPIHYDVEYAKQTRFGRPVAHGYLITIMTAMGGSNLNFAVENSIVAFIEQTSRILRPVFVGDTLTPQGEVIEIVPKGKQGVLKFKTWVTNQNGETVLEGTQTYLIKSREA